MANYTIGDMIYEARVARGYSQEELGYGLCSTSSLSRIENGSQVPGKKLFDALLQRLGISESVYSAFISKEEMELYRIIQQLAWKIENIDLDGIDIMMDDLRHRISERDIFESQYLCFAEATVKKRRGGGNAEVMKLLMKAICLTMPDFDGTVPKKSRLLTFDEISILNVIATIYMEEQKTFEALKLLFWLKEYLEEHIIDEVEKAKKYPMIVYNITKIMGALERHQDVYKLCEEGISFSVKHNKLVILPYMLTNKACAAAELGKMEEAKELFHQAIVLFTICKKDNEADMIKEQISQKYAMAYDSGSFINIV